jgi:hypothetical protein
MVFTESFMTGFDLPANYHSDPKSRIRIGPETNIGDGIFELKPDLINMVQQSPFREKASEDVNAHLQHFLEISITFTI